MRRYGDSFICPEANTMVDAIRAAGLQVSGIARAQTAAWDGSTPESSLISSNPLLSRAEDYVTRQSSPFSAPLTGDACKNVVAEGREILVGLNQIVRDAGETPVADPNPTPGSGGIEDLTTTLKTLAIAAAVIAGVVVVAPLVFDITATRKVRRMARYRRRR